jgi:hypothetical protein
MTRYEDELRERMTKDRLAVTVGQYIQRLRVLNGNKPLTSLKFLMDFDRVIATIDGMDKADSTKTSYLTAVSAVLSMFPKYGALYAKYVAKLMERARTQKGELATNQRNAKQVESIIPMDKILKIWDDLRKEFEAATAITAKVWERYTAYVLLCLYTMISPRRNRDYSQMMIVSKADQATDTTKNYYVRDTNELIFRNYKTSSTYGEQRVAVPDNLAKVLTEYIANYKLVVPTATEPMPLLIHFDGEPISATNGITRILNRSVGKGIGSSALRHIFLSDKFGDTLKEMKAVAADMAHDLATQKDYIKHD